MARIVGLKETEAYVYVGNHFEFVITLVIAIVGIFLTIFIYYRTNKKREPYYLIKNLNLLDNKVHSMGSIGVNYLGKKIESLSVAHIAIWNAGRETINKNDIAPKDPINVTATEGVEILDAKIFYVTDEVNNFKVEVIGGGIKRRVRVDFDYFDFNQGFVLQVFHTGQTKEDVFVTGTVKKVGKIKNAHGKLSTTLTSAFEKAGLQNIMSRLPKKYRRIVLGVMFFLVPLVPLIEVFFPSIKTPSDFKSGIILSLIFVIVYWPLGYLTFRRTVPKEFEVFDEI